MKNVRLFYRKGPRPWLFVKDWVAFLLLRSDTDFWNAVSPVMLLSTSTGCNYSELLKIYRHILNKKPNAILELGSGVSTAVIAHGVRRLAQQGHVCRFVSMEEGEKWHSELLRIFPKDLQNYVELLHSETEDCEIGDGLIRRSYKSKPQMAYDFVFIDGPQIPKTGGYFDGDILDVLEWNKNAFVAFLDQRVTTRAALRRLMPWARVQGDKDFTVFRIPEAGKRTK